MFHFKAPEVVIEVVTNKFGNELDCKPLTYSEWGIQYYVVYDPMNILSPRRLHTFTLVGDKYEPLAAPYLSQVGLGLREVRMVFHGVDATFLRWCDHTGELLMTPDERMQAERHAGTEQQMRAEAARWRTDVAEAQTVRLRALLQKHGITPDQQ